MKWLVDNWSLLIVLLGAALGVVYYIKHFRDMPTDKQLEQVRQWLLFAVIEAEKKYGSGTGALKLRAVYDTFISTFPDFAGLISFTLFSSLVDEALERMKDILKVNKDIDAYVNVEDK